MHKPKIHTAVPKRRYRLGEYLVTVLGEIDSADGIDYRYILATLVEGESEPGLYVTAERQRPEGAYAMRVIMHDGAQVVGSSDRWGELELFAADALDAVVKILGLDDEQIRRLM
jgi:hypothetical protein